MGCCPECNQRLVVNSQVCQKGVFVERKVTILHICKHALLTIESIQPATITQDENVND